jgi:hypothetical protein
METGRLDGNQDPGELASRWENLKATAHPPPDFYEVYDEIYKRLFPVVGCHEIHTDLGGFEEAIEWDEVLISRLKNHGR